MPRKQIGLQERLDAVLEDAAAALLVIQPLREPLRRLADELDEVLRYADRVRENVERLRSMSKLNPELKVILERVAPLPVPEPPFFAPPSKSPEMERWEQEGRDHADELERSIDDIELSIRAYNILKNSDIANIGQLRQLTESQVAKLKNCGKRTQREIKEVLTNLGLSFKPWV